MKLFVTTLILASAGVWAKGFQDDCEYISFADEVVDLDEGVGKSNFVLSGICGPDNTPSRLPLNMCVANQDGKLVWRNHGFMSKTCVQCRAATNDGRMSLQCRCRNVKGEVPVEFDDSAGLFLDENIVWENGAFNCHFKWS